MIEAEDTPRLGGIVVNELLIQQPYKRALPSISASIQSKDGYVVNPMHLSLDHPGIGAFYDPYHSRVILLDDSEDGRLAYVNEMVTRERGITPDAALEKLMDTQIGIVGAGSVGSQGIDALVRCGARGVEIWDGDDYELSNAPRQTTDLMSIAERPKAVEAACAMVRINPYLQTRISPEKMKPQDVKGFVERNDIILLTCDDMEVIQEIHRQAFEAKKPVLYPIDVGSALVLIVYDYTKPNARLHNGYFRHKDLNGISSIEYDIRLLSASYLRDNWGIRNRILQLYFGLRSAPENIARIADKDGPIDHMPQSGATARVAGAVQLVTVLEILGGNPVRSTIKIDLDEVILPWNESVRMTRRAHRKALVRLLKLSKGKQI